VVFVYVWIILQSKIEVQAGKVVNRKSKVAVLWMKKRRCNLFDIRGGGGEWGNIERKKMRRGKVGGLRLEYEDTFNISHFIGILM